MQQFMYIQNVTAIRGNVLTNKLDFSDSFKGLLFFISFLYQYSSLHQILHICRLEKCKELRNI
jgi:hypothetical protein